MTFCSKCGASIDAGVQFCPNCGSPTQSATYQQPTVVAPTQIGNSFTQSRVMNRPTGVTVLAILQLLGGLLMLVIAAGLSAVSSFVGRGFLIAFGGLISGVLAIFGLIGLATAYAFWTGQSWGWWLGIIAAVLDIISIVTLNVINFVIGIIILYYLTRPHVKSWFHEA